MGLNKGQLLLSMGFIYLVLRKLAPLDNAGKWLFLIVCMVLVYFFSKLLEKKFNKSETLYKIIFVIIFVSLALLDKASFLWIERDDRIVFSLLTILIAFFFTNEKCYNKGGKLNRIVSSILMALLLIGYQTFYDDTAFGLSSVRIVRFGLFVIWSEALLNEGILLINKLTQNKNVISGEIKKDTKKLRIILFGIIAFIGIVMSLIFYPGWFTSDVIGCFRQGINIFSERSDLHSFLYQCILALFASFSLNCYYITLTVIAVYALTISSILVYLYRKGLSFKATVIWTFVFGMIPINLLMLISLWKDIPYSLTMLVLTYAIIKLVFEGEAFSAKKLNLLQLGISLVLVVLFRSNGIGSIIIVALVFGILYFIKKLVDKKTMVTVLLACAFVILCKGPIYNALNVDRGPQGFNSLPFLDGIWTNLYYNPSETPEEVHDYFEKILPEEKWHTEYMTGQLNFSSFDDSYANPNIDFNTSVRLWFECLIKNPATTIRARLMKTDIIWSVFRNPDAYMGYNFDPYMDSVGDRENEFGWKFLNGSYVFRSLYYNYLVRIPILSAMFRMIYRGGGALCLMLIILNDCIERKKCKYILTFLPMLGSSFSLMIGMCAQDYRYIYPMFLCMFFIVPSYIVWAAE